MSGQAKQLRGRIEEFLAEFTGDAALQQEGRERVLGGGSPDADRLPETTVANSSSGHLNDATGSDTTPMVRDRAYELWERAGRPYGREYEFWFQASREIEGDIELRKRKANERRIVAR